MRALSRHKCGHQSPYSLTLSWKPKTLTGRAAEPSRKFGEGRCAQHWLIPYCRAQLTTILAPRVEENPKPNIRIADMQISPGHPLKIRRKSGVFRRNPADVCHTDIGFCA